MSEKAKTENKKRRDAEKADRRNSNREKSEVKKVSVWDKINAEKSGKVVESTDADGKVTKTRTKTRVLSANARQSHHRGHNPQRGNVCIDTKDGVKKVKRETADELVASGKASYTTRSEWRKTVRDAGKKTK